MNYSSIVSFYAGKRQSPSTLATSGAPFWVTSNPDGTLTCFKFIKHLPKCLPFLVFRGHREKFKNVASAYTTK